MVPKESGFNQSVAASGMCARKSWRFPGSTATVRDGKLLQMPHSCHHVETIRHQNSSYITTKLYGTSTCGWNNNTIFSKRAILTFLTVDVCRARYRGGRQAFIMHAKVAIWRYCWLHYFSCLKFRFCQSTVSTVWLYYKVVLYDVM